MRDNRRTILERIAARQPDVGAWAQLDLAPSARAVEPGAPLAGMVLGVKDTIDVAGMVSGCGSAVHRDHRAHLDSAIVAALRQAGADILGKTATAELAFLSPATTRNPLDLSRSPGGSSSGSAAAVADGQADVAIGTQTAGSVIRPAAFCGVVGFKPTHGAVSLAGVKPTSPSLDTLGWFTHTVDDARRLWEVLAPSPSLASPGRPTLGRCRTHHWEAAEPEMRSAFDRLTTALEIDVDGHLPVETDAMHETILGYELRAELATELLQFEALLTPKLIEYLSRPVEYAQYRAAQDAAAAVDHDALFAGADVLLTPATPGEAVPYGSTGDPRFNRAWTLLGLPCITLPFATGAHELPLGIQLVGRRDHEDALLAAADDVAELIASELW